MSELFAQIYRSTSFAFWSLRRHSGQVLPVALAILLLVCTVQAIGALHDVSSVLTRQQIAKSWRSPYDLLVRPQSAASQPERSAGWLNPQSALENYGGISVQQINTILSLPDIVQVTPFATLGWQNIAVQLPVWLARQGIYRISATWPGQGISGSDVVHYVDVTDLHQLTSEFLLSSPILEHLTAINAATPVAFVLSLQAIQAVVGIPASQQATLPAVLLQGLAPASAAHLLIHVDKLRGDLRTLPACVKYASCWQSQAVVQGSISYQVDGVQLLRYSRTSYSATPQQLAAGQVTLESIGDDTQGPLYRMLLAERVPVPADYQQALTQGPLALLPFSALERMPLIASAVHFIPLEQACKVNGVFCYSGLYVRLNGVDSYSQRSLAQLQSTSAAITARTGLRVDILDGSSPRTITLVASGAQTGETVQSSWLALGVAVQIVHGVDALQLTLLVLCSTVCLFAIAAAGVLVGIGRRKDAYLLQQVGWHRHLLSFTFLVDALTLSLPGTVLAASFILLAAFLLPGSLSPTLIWFLLGMGVLLYCCALVGVACSMPFGRPLLARKPGRDKGVHAHEAPGKLPTSTLTGNPLISLLPIRAVKSTLHRYAFSQAFHAKVIAPGVCAFAVAAAVFLIAVEFLLVTSFNRVLVVTVLGNQVREALEGTQLLLLLLMLAAAVLTLGLCTTLLLQGRRNELSLLAQVGWERRAVLLRLMWDSWWPALVSGEVGAFLALTATLLSGTSPSWLIALGLLFCGPVLGVLLVSLASLGPAWQETQKVFRWR